MKPIKDTKIDLKLAQARKNALNDKGERGISQNELARKLGMSPTGVQRYEWGEVKSIPFEVLEKFCEALDCKPSDLLKWKE